MTTYPNEFHDLMIEAHSRGEFSVPCSSPQEARTLRGNLYAFREHLRRERSHLAQVANALSFTVDGNNLTLRRSEPIGTDAVRQALSSTVTGTVKE